MEGGIEETTYKVLVVGESGIGKTSIVKRLAYNNFLKNYQPTVGVDFAVKKLKWSSGQHIVLQLWDIAGQQSFGNMVRAYYRGSSGAFLVYDVTDLASLERLRHWKTEIDIKLALPDDKSIPMVLLGNKCDLAHTSKDMEEFCKELGIKNQFKTSAKEDIGINAATNCLVSQMLAFEQKEPTLVPDHHVETEGDLISLYGDEKTVNKGNCC